MKKSAIWLLIFIGLILSLNLRAQSVDLSKKPEPLPEKEFKFPDFKVDNLDNKLKVFIIEDHEQPTISMRLLIQGGKSVDTLKPGIAEITAALLTKGTSDLNALDIANKLDGLGASIASSATTDYITVEASGLKKHLKTILEIYSKIITAPSFPSEELQKIIPQMKASIQQEKTDPRSIASKMGRKAVYGEKHPYALDPTEESLSRIELNDIKNYYKSYFVPNNATLAIIGDVDPKTIISELKKVFKNWKESDKPLVIKVPQADPMPLGVYFIERPGSVQSTINVTSKAMSFGSLGYDKLSLASGVISSGIAGRLFHTLREKYSYTYSPYGSLSQNKFSGRFYCGSDVKNSVTDSALSVTLEQISTLYTQKPSVEEINRVKNYLAGSYKMSFENSGFVAVAIQNEDFYGLPAKYMADFPNKIIGLNNYDVMEIAKEYLNTKRAYIIVVGSSEVKDKLTKFGKLYEFDMNLKPLTGEGAKLEPVSLDAEELLEEYVNAIGGKEAIGKILTITDSASATMINNGNEMKGNILQFQKAPGKKHFIMDMGIFKQIAWIDGDSVWIKMDKVIKLQASDAEQYIHDATMFKDAYLIEKGYTCKVLGKQAGLILMKSISPQNKEATYYFDAETFLIKKIERIEEMSQGKIPITENYKDYISIEGVKLPGTIELSSPLYTMITVNQYVVNSQMDDSLFHPKE